MVCTSARRPTTWGNSTTVDTDGEPSPGGVFTEITKGYTFSECEEYDEDGDCLSYDKDSYDYVMTRHSKGQYGILGFLPRLSVRSGRRRRLRRATLRPR